MTTASPGTHSTIPPLRCYLNGDFVELREARISVLDRGFIFGDGVYDVVPIHAGRPFRLREHLDRLERGLNELRIPNPITRDEWSELVHQLSRFYYADTQSQAESVDLLAYLQVTRGVAMRDHAMLQGLTPTVFGMVNPLPNTATQRQTGIECVSSEDFRWKKAHLKTTSLLGSIFSRQISIDANVDDTIMFRDGYLSEASASNAWIVKDGALIGVPPDNLVLQGIRYGVLNDLCFKENIPFFLRKITHAEVLEASELMLTSAIKRIVAVTRLDGREIGNGTPGPLFQRLLQAYDREIANSI